MKNKFLIVSILAGAFFVPAFCLGAISYSRTPSGYNINNPVNLTFSGDTIEDLFPDDLPNFWNIEIYNEGEDWSFYAGGCIASSTISYNENLTLPAGVYDFIELKGYADDLCENINSTGIELETGGGIFKIPLIPVIGGIVVLPGNALSSTTEYVGSVMGSIGAFLWLAIGVPLAFYVIAKWLKTLP